MLVAVVVVTAVVFGISFLSYELMVLANPNQSHELRALGVAHEWAAVIALILGLVEGIWILGTRKKLDSHPARIASVRSLPSEKTTRRRGLRSTK